jgi:uncharacterized protein
MNLTDPERLMLIMLSEIHDHLKIKNGVDPKFVQSAIYTGNTWGLPWRYTDIFDGGTSETPPKVHDVVKILDMWRLIESSFANLSPEEQALVKKEVAPHGVKFNGFDGNNDTDSMGIARFLIEDIGEFANFKGRELNSHYIDSTDGYHRMLEVLEPMRSALGNADLTSSQIISILKAQHYPK